MTELTKVFLPLIVGTLAAGLYGVQPRLFVGAARALYLLELGVCAALVFTGNVGDARNGPHLYLAHAYFIFVWCALPFGIGVCFGSALYEKRWWRFGLAALPALALVTSMLAAFSGYLARGAPDNNALLRFIVLHKLFFPSLTVLLLLASLLSMRGFGKSAR